MYPYDPVTEFRISRLRQHDMDSRLAMLRLVSEAGVTEPSLAGRVLSRVGSYLSHLDARARGTSSRAV